MISETILDKVRLLELSTRKAVISTFAGNYHSAFKGSGIHVTDSRPYSDSDDSRHIDWNVTARTGDVHVKQFEEERELTMLLMVDVSASSWFGSSATSKIEYGTEIAAVLGFSAIKNHDRVGLLLFSDTVEQFILPKKGKAHMFRMLRDMIGHHPVNRRTNIGNALQYAAKVLKKRAIICILSDFQDDSYQASLKRVVTRHDVVPIIIEDPREQDLPDVGLATLEDPETGQQCIINTSSRSVQDRFKNIVLSRQLARDRLLKQCGLTAITCLTDRDYHSELRRYFKYRQRLK